MRDLGAPCGTARDDSPAAEPPAQTRSLHIVLPTFDRPLGLRAVLGSLQQLGTSVDQVYVIDNGTDDDVELICRGFDETGPPSIIYIRPPENIGPAGATAEAMLRLVGAARDGWLLRVDDDRPLEPAAFTALLAFADEQHAASGGRVAAVGMEGATWSPLAARLRTPERRDGEPTEVDYLKTGMYPLFRIDAMRHVGTFRRDLFFGMTEVEYGLRLRRAGYSLIEASHLRSAVGATSRPSLSSSADWRRYYSLRNLLVILRDTGHPLVAVRVAVVRGVFKPAVGLLVRRPDAGLTMRLTMRAVFDAFTGRMGKRIDPAAWSRERDRDAGDRPHT